MSRPREDDASARRRMRVALDLFEAGEAMVRQRLARERQLSGDELARAVRQWRVERPGAEGGDAPGKPRDLRRYARP